MTEPLVIVDADGTEHEFPAGMDPKRAAAIVRSQTTGPQEAGSQTVTAQTGPRRRYETYPTDLMQRPQSASGVPEALAETLAGGLMAGPVFKAGAGALRTVAGTRLGQAAGTAGMALAENLPGGVGKMIRGGRLAWNAAKPTIQAGPRVPTVTGVAAPAAEAMTAGAPQTVEETIDFLKAAAKTRDLQPWAQTGAARWKASREAILRQLQGQ